MIQPAGFGGTPALGHRCTATERLLDGLLGEVYVDETRR